MVRILGICRILMAERRKVRRLEACKGFGSVYPVDFCQTWASALILGLHRQCPPPTSDLIQQEHLAGSCEEACVEGAKHHEILGSSGLHGSSGTVVGSHRPYQEGTLTVDDSIAA